MVTMVTTALELWLLEHGVQEKSKHFNFWRKKSFVTERDQFLLKELWHQTWRMSKLQSKTYDVIVENSPDKFQVWKST